MSASAPGPVPSGRSPHPLRAIPRSRAYWELKAEQMMNRIFDPSEPIDLEVEPAPESPLIHADASQAPASNAAPLAAVRLIAVGSPAAATTGVAAGEPTTPTATSRSGLSPVASATGAIGVGAASVRRHRPSARAAQATPPAAATSGRLRRPDERLLLIGALCGVCLASVVGSLLYFGHWSRLQQNIAQERNLLLLERLRSLGPATPTPVQGPEPAAPILPAPAASSTTATEGLPPPPPQEAWIEQLSSLPQSAPSTSRVLTVPVNPRLAASAPAARPSSSPTNAPARSSARPSAPLPQLVGVVVGAGRVPSAIFLVGGSSMSVTSGEQIGSTGWRLRSAEGETALIERGGELRQVSIASGNGF